MNIYRIKATFDKGFQLTEVVAAESEQHAIEISHNSGEDWVIDSIEMIGTAHRGPAGSLCCESL